MRGLLDSGGKRAIEGSDAGSTGSYSSGSQDARGDFAGGKDSEQGHETLRQTILGLPRPRLGRDRMISVRTWPALPLHRSRHRRGYALS
ncbi:hypothetical protein D3C73_1361050 [compost metagenome]